MKKSKNTPIIPELTRSGYQAFFENFDDSWVFEPEYPLKKNEPKIVKALQLKFGEKAQIFAVREVAEPDGVSVPDLIFNGEKAEIKTISSKRSIERQLRKANIQQSSVVIFDISNISITDEEMLKRAEFEASRRGIFHFGFFDGEKIVHKNEKKENSLTELYPKQDQTASDFIISQNSKKVKIASTNPDELGVKIKEGKKKNTAASYARHDSAIHNLILSQHTKKVKVSSTDFNKLEINTVQKHEKTHESIKTLGISPKFSKKPSTYWQKRSLQRTVAAERQALPYIRKLREEYARSSNRSIDNVRRIYENYFSKAGFDRQKLREIVPSGELSKYLKEVRKLGIELPDNYKYRVSREEFAQAQLWLEAKKLGVFENRISTDLYSKIINQSFTQTFGDYGVNFAKLNTESMNQILNSKFHGENFSTRIWDRTDRLADELQAKLAFAVAKGQSWEKTSREIRERFGVSQSSAERLIRTETNYFENSAEMEAYSELGVEEFEFLAALDGRTSEICRHHHRKRFKVKDAKAGVNTPPLHPNCRSTVVAVIPELERDSEVTDIDVGNKAIQLEADSFKEGAETIGVEIVKPKPVDTNMAINFDVPELANFDKKLMSTQKQEVGDILGRYSVVAEYLSGNGGLKIKAINVRKDYMASVSFTSSRETGVRLGITSLNMAKTFFRNPTKMFELVKHGVDTGYFMSASEDNFEKYAISHEMGHILESFLMIREKTNARHLAREYENDILKIATGYSGLTADKTKSRYMSEYGKSDPEEFFAEAFAGLRCGVKNPITKAMKQFLKEKF